MKNLVCPISEERVNEQITRLNAMFTIGLIVLGISFNTVFIFVYLFADFFIRGFTEIKYSPVSYASYSLSNALNLQVRLIDKAPKIFAARLGLLMIGVISVLLFLKLNIAAYIVAGILIFFAGLEFIFAICVGCIIYTYIVLPFYKQK